MRVLVTGARMWYAINTIRLLAQGGYEVFAADSKKLSGGLYSRYLKGKFIYPSVSENGRAFVRCLMEKIEELEIGVLFPTFEEGFVLSKHSDLLEGRVKIIVPSYEHIRLLHDKFLMTNYARSLGISVPGTMLLKNFEPTDSSFPIVIKPRNLRSAEGISKVNSKDEFTKYSKDLDGDKHLVQEWKHPYQICTTGLAYNGQVIANVIYHNLREYPESGGIGTCRISIECEEVLGNVKKIVSDLNYSGFISMDFLHERDSNGYYLVDVNPRMSPGLLVAYTSGLDMVSAYIDLVIKNEAPQLSPLETGNGTYTTAMEIGWFFSTLFKGKFGNLKGFFKSRKKLKDDSWDARDPAPFFVMLWSMLYTAIFGPLKGGQTKSFSLGATCDIESLDEEEIVDEKRQVV
ncbi:MAG TPA: ATP-grasp domain-containing protein [Mesotoga infera]|uniref:ATP-grasp domain-containing protein n=1 Tax=Mesotoga infera TaxID=1236046 RepID=A0A7C1H8D9_9BACT|nr:ATP-grasp domain-containing protein [Mesotoga infera]